MNASKLIELYIIIIFIMYIYLLHSVFSSNIFIIRSSIFLCIFLFLKLLINHRKCTFSYLECKLRNIKKEEGIIYNLCNFHGDLIYTSLNIYIYIIVLLVLIINVIKLRLNIYTLKN